MKRYNQGFYKFGPMEQCKDGEWAKYEDLEKEFDEFKNEWYDEIAYHKQVCSEAIEKANKERLIDVKEADFYRFVAAISISVNAGFIISEIINRFFL